MVVQYRPYAFVVPNVRARGDEKRLTWLVGISINFVASRSQTVLTAIDMRHIEHSDECADAVSESLAVSDLPRFRSRLWVLTLDMH